MQESSNYQSSNLTYAPLQCKNKQKSGVTAPQALGQSLKKKVMAWLEKLQIVELGEQKETNNTLQMTMQTKVDIEKEHRQVQPDSLFPHTIAHAYS